MFPDKINLIIMSKPMKIYTNVYEQLISGTHTGKCKGVISSISSESMITITQKLWYLNAAFSEQQSRF